MIAYCLEKPQKRGNEVLVFAGPLEEKKNGWKTSKPCGEDLSLLDRC